MHSTQIRNVKTLLNLMSFLFFDNKIILTLTDIEHYNIFSLLQRIYKRARINCLLYYQLYLYMRRSCGQHVH